MALAIFSAGAMALYGLFNTNLIALNRVEDITRLIPVARHSLEVLSSVNPWEQAAGEFEYDGLNITWSARLLEPVRHGQNTIGMMTAYDLGLYEVEFEVSEGGRRLDTWRTRLVGYANLRGFDQEIFF